MVKHGRVARPELRGGEGEILREGGCGSGGNRLAVFLARDFFPARVEQNGGEGCLRRIGGIIVLHAGRDADLRVGLGGFRRGDVGSPLRDVNGLSSDEPDMAIEAAAGIPAASGLINIEPHGEDVFLRTKFCVWGEVVKEAGVAIRMVAEKLAVEVNIRIHVSAIEENGNALPLGRVGQGKSLAVPSYAAVEVPAAIPSRGFLIERPLHGAGIGSGNSLDHEIMRKIEGTPG